jgi:2,3-dihydroxybenzoate decarboxylase
MKKIALEEHVIFPDFLEDTRSSDFTAMTPQDAADFEIRLLDVDDLRIETMDNAGIDISVLSLTSPGIQGIADPELAQQMAVKANDLLAERIARHPDRFRGFACLSMDDPLKAAAELERCVNEHHFLGALINGQTKGHYLDEKRFFPFWEKVEELDVPIYLHPGSPPIVPKNFKHHHELAGALWGWTVETGTHALRMIFSGLFDRFPGIKLILGHMGETLPFLLWRLDSRWKILKHPLELKLSPSHYLKKHFFVTTSGMCANGPLMCAIHELGEDRVMFSVDYPYESSDAAAMFIKQAPITDELRKKICYQNARDVLNLR